MRLSEAEYNRLIKGGPEAVISEGAFLAAIRRLAAQSGWLFYHTHNSKRSPEGFPDVVLAKRVTNQQASGLPIIMAELKTMTGQLTKPQEAWLEAIAGSTGVVSATWRPDNLEAIVELLRRGC